MAYYQPGRFAATKDGKAYVAFDKTIPANWEPLVGKEWVGQPFAEYPQAEETYRAQVNDPKSPMYNKWGSGPLVSTTHNYSGFVILPALSPEDEEDLMPVRLSLKRTDVQAARKFISLKKMLRLRTFWDTTFKLTTAVKPSGRHESYIVQVAKGRPTTDDEKMAAVHLAQEVAAQRVRVTGDDSEPTPSPETPEGALAV